MSAQRQMTALQAPRLPRVSCDRGRKGEHPEYDRVKNNTSKRGIERVGEREGEIEGDEREGQREGEGNKEKKRREGERWGERHKEGRERRRQKDQPTEKQSATETERKKKEQEAEEQRESAGDETSWKSSRKWIGAKRQRTAWRLRAQDISNTACARRGPC